ncbi:MAG: hypothetical protein ABI658_32230, partial [Acidimicrobiales bacterium]
HELELAELHAAIVRTGSDSQRALARFAPPAARRALPFCSPFSFSGDEMEGGTRFEDGGKGSYRQGVVPARGRTGKGVAPEGIAAPERSAPKGIAAPERSAFHFVTGE